jgi:hypothetical protein
VLQRAAGFLSFLPEFWYNQAFLSPLSSLAMNPKLWLLDGHVARLNLPGLSLDFNADRPAEGLVEISVADRPWPGGRLLGVTGSIQTPITSLTDWHVRGDDLIAVYETGLPDAARLDLLWHAARPGPGDAWLARVDLLVSVRTDRLDWRQDVRLESVLPEMTLAEALDTDGNLLSARDWSLAVMVHPADMRQTELTAEPATPARYRICCQLFRIESLEKGVILRARARAWFLPSGVDPVAAAACFSDFTAADPPLGV